MKLKNDDVEWYGGKIDEAPESYVNTHNNWTQTLRRVWRGE